MAFPKSDIEPPKPPSFLDFLPALGVLGSSIDRAGKKTVGGVVSQKG
jgi:hypothetical protein